VPAPAHGPRRLSLTAADDKGARWRSGCGRGSKQRTGEMTQVSRMHRTFERPAHLSAASNAAGCTTESVNTDEKLLRLQPPQNPPHWPPQVCPLVSHVICDMGPSPQVVQAFAPPGIPNGVDVRSSCIGLPKPGGGHVQSVFAPKTVRSTTFTHCGMVENVASVRLTVTERLPGVRPLITLRVRRDYAD
jgi:hypothetical protein